MSEIVEIEIFRPDGTSITHLADEFLLKYGSEVARLPLFELHSKGATINGADDDDVFKMRIGYRKFSKEDAEIVRTFLAQLSEDTNIEITVDTKQLKRPFKFDAEISPGEPDPKRS